MAQHQTEDTGAAAVSGSDGDLSKFLLQRLAVQKREFEIDKIFQAVVKLEGSDLHMRVGSPPFVRTKGELRAFNLEPINMEEMVRLVTPMLDERARVRAIVRFRDAVMNLVNVTGGMAFLHYRRAGEDLLRLVLGREPTDEELDEILCERRR